MTKVKKVNKRKRRTFILAILSLVVIFVITFSIGRYWVEIFDKYQEKKELDKQLTSLKEKEEELQVDAKKLQNPDYVARYAREKYSYSKDGEYILQIPDK